jgi:hypothetical protein
MPTLQAKALSSNPSTAKKKKRCSKPKYLNELFKTQRNLINLV